jgi:hypothetical protein
MDFRACNLVRMTIAVAPRSAAFPKLSNPLPARAPGPQIVLEDVAVTSLEAVSELESLSKLKSDGFRTAEEY